MTDDVSAPTNRIVSAARARELIKIQIDALTADMEVVRDGVWARSLTNEIRAVIRVEPLKGAQYNLTYGICCAWVPTSAGSNQFGRFPRTLKQTTLHLWVDHFTLDAQPRQWVSTLYGEGITERQAVTLGQQVTERAPAWWRSVDSPDGVLTEARRQARNRHDIHFPRARVVAAFTWARLNDMQAARAELNASDHDAALDPLLAKVPSLPNHPSG